MAGEQNLGANFSIDIANLRAGLKEANQIIRESQSEFKAAAAGMDDWTKSEDGLSAKLKSLTTTAEAQQAKVDALKQEYKRLIDDGLDPTSNEASKLRTQINNEEAALNKTKKEIDDNTQALDELGNETEDASKKTGKFTDVLKNVGKVAAAALGAAAAGLAAITKQAVEGYADYEQLVGGVETLFGTGGKSIEEYAKSVGKSVDEVKAEYDKLKGAEETMLKNANDAYKTAGLSANEYMENVTAFSASLISSLDGDTQKAADAANEAMIDMSDNANKMGTDIASIQNAYQGFAKQNYTMLDNLKLGYGGTQAEMYRLLEDAAKLDKEFAKTANFNLDSSGHLTAEFSDITKAIHIVQTEMGITGTTAREASSTIQGSASAMKSAWSNLLTGMADENADIDQLITNLVDSVGTFIENLLPRITIATQGILKVIQGLIPQIPPLMQEFLPVIIDGLMNLLDGVVAVLPSIIDTIMQIIPQLITKLVEMIPTLVKTTVEIILQIATAILDNLPTIINAIMTVVPTIITELVSSIPDLIDAAIRLLFAIVNAIPKIIPPLIEALPQIIETIFNALKDSLPSILNAAIELFYSLIDAISIILPTLIDTLPEIIEAIMNGLLDNLPLLLEAAIDLFMAIVEAIPIIIPQIVKAIPQIISAIFNALTSDEAINNIKQAGKDLIKGLWNGIKDMAGWIKEKISGFGDSVLGALKDFFGIASPSKVMRDTVGKNLALGIGEGFTKNIGKVNDEITEAMNFDDPTFNVSGTYSGRGYGSGKNIVVNQYNTYSQAHSRYEIYKSKQQTAAAVRLAVEGA